MALNSARVGAGSLPLKPPMASTGTPSLPSSSEAALVEPTVAAAHR